MPESTGGFQDICGTEYPGLHGVSGFEVTDRCRVPGVLAKETDDEHSRVPEILICTRTQPYLDHF